MLKLKTVLTNEKVIYHRGYVGAGATGVIAPVNFQKYLFEPVNFPSTFREKSKLDGF